MIPAIIPTYKGEARLPKVLDCVKKQSWQTTAWLRDNNVNGVYYTKAVNEGLREFAFQENNDFCLVLCDDVYMDPKCVEELVFAARQNPRAGIISPVQYAVGEPYKCNWAGAGKSWPWGQHLTMVLSETPYPTLWASGAVFLVRTAMIKEIGLLDENMRFICSDSDYSLTARSRGWRCMVAPTAKVEHDFGGSAKADAELDFIKTKDALYFTRKWVSGGLFRSLEFKGHDITMDEIATHSLKLADRLINPVTL
jgi:GT2 family glycosyltransferase